MGQFMFRRHTIGSVNAELIKCGLGLYCGNNLYSLHKRKRGQPFSKRVRFYNCKMDAYNDASDIVNAYFNNLKELERVRMQTLKNEIL